MSIPVFGIDPGFASIGFSVVLLDGSKTEVPIRMGLLSTAKSNKKSNVLASDDNLRRAREIYVALKPLLISGEYGPVRAVCAETMSYPRNSSAAAKMAMCWGVLAALTEELDIPVLQVTPQDLKKKVCGQPTASKEDIQKALDKRFGKSVIDGLLGKLAAGKHEHPCDALGAVVACLDSDILRAMRRMS